MDKDYARFQRQLDIKDIGTTGQKKLQKAHVVIVGAGGLGCPVLTYLASAGVGKISIIDMDDIEISNLNRQFLYGKKDIGKPKAQTAAAVIQEKYSDVIVNGVKEKLEAHNIESLLFKADVIVDCVDSIKTRLLVNDFAIAKEIPLVEGGIDGWYGYCLCISKEGPCLRCAGYSEKFQQKSTAVLGATAGVIGSIQASHTIKILINGIQEFTGRIIQYDGKEMCIDSIQIHRNQQCPAHTL